MSEQRGTQAQTTWLQKTGVFFAWAGGIAGSTVSVTALAVAILNLFKGNRFATFFRDLSDWTFWAFAILLFIGLLVPNEPEADSSGRKSASAPQTSRASTERASPATTVDPAKGAPDPHTTETRAQRAIRRRIARVYNPWRWRFWAASLFTLAVSVLVGLALQTF